MLAPKLEPIARFLNRNLGWLFLFKQGNVSLAGGGTIFTAGIVLSVMILPIVTSISREVFRQTPLIQIEAALALGATKWEVVRMTVLPYGRSGVVAASMLGLGRALGETVAVLVILRSAARPGPGRCSTAVIRSLPRSPPLLQNSANRCRPEPIFRRDLRYSC